MEMGFTFSLPIRDRIHENHQFKIEKLKKFVCFDWTPSMEKRKYRKSLKETRGSYFFIVASNAGLIQGRVSFKGGSY